MPGSRLWLAGACAALAAAAAPLLLPFASALSADSWSAWAESDRLTSLAGNTLKLTTATLLLCAPAGVALAVLLYRSDVPGRSVCRAALLVALFVPLPVFATAWQAAAFREWVPAVPGGAWRPWQHGWWPAAVVHALAGLPWVVWVVGRGLCAADRHVEDAARLEAGPASVLWRVTLPAALPAVGLAAAFVAARTATEIDVTDLFGVRTFAEEVYTQFVAGGDGLGRVIVLNLPVVINLAIIVGLGVWVSRRSIAAGGVAAPPRTLLRFGRRRWPVGVAVTAAVAGYVLVPVGVLAGRAGWPAWRLHLPLIADSLLWSMAAGAVAATLALVACRLADGRRWLSTVLIILAVAGWVVPGPVVGLGLKGAIDRLMSFEEWLLGGPGPARAWLYDRPSPLPVLAAAVVRVFPFALALMAVAVRRVPAALTEAARLEGAGVGQDLRHVVWPLARGPWLAAALACGVLALGELSAGKLVETPGRFNFIHEVFNLMHYGVGPALASLCLMHLAVVTLSAGVISCLTHTLDPPE